MVWEKQWDAAVIASQSSSSSSSSCKNAAPAPSTPSYSPYELHVRRFVLSAHFDASLRFAQRLYSSYDSSFKTWLEWDRMEHAKALMIRGYKRDPTKGNKPEKPGVRAVLSRKELRELMREAQKKLKSKMQTGGMFEEIQVNGEEGRPGSSSSGTRMSVNTDRVPSPTAVTRALRAGSGIGGGGAGSVNVPTRFNLMANHSNSMNPSVSPTGAMSPRVSFSSTALDTIFSS